ncbi:hypothetical protein K0M31_014053, partial [Melipona bicolor]
EERTPSGGSNEETDRHQTRRKPGRASTPAGRFHPLAIIFVPKPVSSSSANGPSSRAKQTSLLLAFLGSLCRHQQPPPFSPSSRPAVSGTGINAHVCSSRLRSVSALPNPPMYTEQRRS